MAEEISREQARAILRVKLADLDRRLALAGLIRKVTGEYPHSDFWREDCGHVEPDQGTDAREQALRQWRQKLRRAGMKG